MDSNEFENELRSRPWRKLPDAWRADILSAAQAARASDSAPASQKRGEGLIDWLWPHPLAWAGMAALWLVILGLQIPTRQSEKSGFHASAPPAPAATPAIRMALNEQRKLRAELLGVALPSEKEARKEEARDPVESRPRSALPLANFSV